MNTLFIRRFWVTVASYGVGFYASIVNRFRTFGAENLPRKGGVLLAANHISGYETVFIPWAVVRHYPWQMVWAPAKEELFRNPVLGFLFRSWGAFPVKRGRDVRAGKQIEQLLQSDKVMLFPEGTRNKDGRLGKGNRGVGKMIYESRPMVIPVALTGLNRWHFPGIGQKGTITFGAPLSFDDLFTQENNRETQTQIVDRVMVAIADLLPPEQQPEKVEES